MRGTGATRTRISGGIRHLFEDEVDDFSLADVEAGLGFEHLAHLHTIELLVALGAGAPDSRTARGIQEAELDADGIGYFAHDAAEGIDLAHEVALGHASNGRIAAHLRNQVEVHGNDGGFQAHARGSHGRFAASVPSAHHDDIVLFGERHPILFYGYNGIAICDLIRIETGRGSEQMVETRLLFSIMAFRDLGITGWTDRHEHLRLR